MTITLEVYIGIDVSKDKLDIAIWNEKKCRDVANSKRGITKLVKQLRDWKAKLIVVEATGGYEEAVVMALFEAGLPVALVSPQQVRQYAQAKGWLAKTDRLDAQILADHGKQIQPRLLWAKAKSENGYLSCWDGENNLMTCCKQRKIACAPGS